MIITEKKLELVKNEILGRSKDKTQNVQSILLSVQIEDDKKIGRCMPLEGGGYRITRAFGEYGLAFKDYDAFEKGESPCYMPKRSDRVYTRQDFLDICSGQESLAREVFDYITWQHPETYIDEKLSSGMLVRCCVCGKLHSPSQKCECNKAMDDTEFASFASGIKDLHVIDRAFLLSLLMEHNEITHLAIEACMFPDGADKSSIEKIYEFLHEDNNNVLFESFQNTFNKLLSANGSIEMVRIAAKLKSWQKAMLTYALTEKPQISKAMIKGGLELGLIRMDRLPYHERVTIGGKSFMVPPVCLEGEDVTLIHEYLENAKSDEYRYVFDVLLNGIEDRAGFKISDILEPSVPVHSDTKNSTQTVTEWCPHCEREATFEWNVEEQGYKAFCPSCGKLLMLCSECQGHGFKCDWNEEKNSCSMMEKKTDFEERAADFEFCSKCQEYGIKCDWNEEEQSCSSWMKKCDCGEADVYPYERRIICILTQI